MIGRGLLVLRVRWGGSQSQSWQSCPEVSGMPNLIVAGGNDMHELAPVRNKTSLPLRVQLSCLAMLLCQVGLPDSLRAEAVKREGLMVGMSNS